MERNPTLFDPEPDLIHNLRPGMLQPCRLGTRWRVGDARADWQGFGHAPDLEGKRATEEVRHSLRLAAPPAAAVKGEPREAPLSRSPAAVPNAARSEGRTRLIADRVASQTLRRQSGT